MKTYFKYSLRLLLASSLPLFFALLIYPVPQWSTQTTDRQFTPHHWTLSPEDVKLDDRYIDHLTLHLYEETNGKQRPDVLLSLITAVYLELNQGVQPAGYLLGDLMRDLSLEHKNSLVRYEAYLTMLHVLESEESSGTAPADPLLS